MICLAIGSVASAVAADTIDAVARKEQGLPPRAPFIPVCPPPPRPSYDEGSPFLFGLLLGVFLS